MELSIFLSTVAGLGYTLAYLEYNRGVINGGTRPNAATWAIWSAISLVSAGSYFSATGDFWKSLLPAINIVLCIGTFVLSTALGKFRKLDATDWIALGVGFVAVMVWGIWKSASYANLVVQLAIMIGFFPTWRAIWRTGSCERSCPWWIWTISYCISLIVVILRWKEQWVDLAHPVNGTLLHASVPILLVWRLRATR